MNFSSKAYYYYMRNGVADFFYNIFPLSGIPRKPFQTFKTQNPTIVSYSYFTKTRRDIATLLIVIVVRLTAVRGVS